MNLFKDILGNQSTLNQLEADFKQGNLVHASLFEGPAGTGKSLVARRLARALFCENTCGSCQICHLVESGAHPDLSLLLDDGQSIKIETIRNLIHTVNLSAQSGKRCIIIERAERMPTEAQNAFLKTLEEPAGNCFFILTINDLTQILPTLLSRVRVYPFLPISNPQITKLLMNEYRAEGTLAEEISELAQGRPGLAVKLLQEMDTRENYKKLYWQIERFFTQNDLLAKMQFAETLEKDMEQMERFFEMGFYYLRKIIHLGSKQIAKKSMDLKQVAELFESLLKTRYVISKNVNKRLALEDFFLQTERPSI